MPLFGGDPRILPIQILLDINKYYDILVIPLLIMNHLNKMNDQDTTIIGLIHLICEFGRILLVGSHKKAHIPPYVAYFIFTFIPVLVLDFIYLLAINRTGPFVKSVLIGFIIQHLLQLIFGAFSYTKFSRYQQGFVEFANNKNQMSGDNGLFDD